MGVPRRPAHRFARSALFALSLASASSLAGSANAEATSAAIAGAARDASSSSVPPLAYEDAIDRAVDEHERGHFEEAREHFRAAHELFPSARTLRGLGKVEFELRNYGESVKLLEASLRSEVRPLDQGLRAEVAQLLERARTYVGEVHVQVDPGTATVSVDGVPVASGPEAALELLVGDHLLEFRATGHLPERRQIRVRGGDRVRVRVELSAPELNDSERAPNKSPSESEQTPLRSRWWLWTAVGVVAAGTAVALAVTLPKGGSSSYDPGGTSDLELGRR